MKPIVGDFVFVDVAGNGQIIDIDEDEEICEVLLENDEPIFDKQLWYSTENISVLKREYKIINLTESPDFNTGQMKLLAELTPIQKMFSFVGNELHCISSFDPNDIEVFILPMNCIYREYFTSNPQVNKIIKFKEFRSGILDLDGKMIKVQFLLM